MEPETVSTGHVPSSAHRGPISHAIFRVARLHRMLAGQLLREVGLHPSQELVMMELWERGPLRQVDLTQLVGSDSATMTRTVRRLEQAGFVRRCPSPTDKRSVIIEPTAASLALRQKVEDLWADLERYVTDGFTGTEQSQMLTVLERVEDNLVRQGVGDVPIPPCIDEGN